MAPWSQPRRIFPFQNNPSYMDLLSQTQRNYRFQEILPQWLFSGKPSRIFPFQKIPIWIFSAKPREFFHSKKIIPRWLFQPAPEKFSISKNFTSMALFSQTSRIFPFQKKPPCLFWDRPREFIHSKNHTSMSLFSQPPPPKNFRFQKIFPPWLFSASPHEFFLFKKSLLQGCFQPASSNYSISNKHTYMAFSIRPLEFFAFKKSYLHGSLKPAPPRNSQFQLILPHCSFQPAHANFSISKIIHPWHFSASPLEFFPANAVC